MGSVISCSELIINQECCTSAFSPLLLQQPLLHLAVLSTVKPQLQPLLPHGKSPSKSKEVISAGFVMSACHCSQSRAIDVVMGTVDYTKPKFNIKGTFTCHPQYSTFPATDYDYSIVTLASNVDLNDADVSAI